MINLSCREQVARNVANEIFKLGMTTSDVALKCQTRGKKISLADETRAWRVTRLINLFITRREETHPLYFAENRGETVVLIKSIMSTRKTRKVQLDESSLCEETGLIPP